MAANVPNYRDQGGATDHIGNTGSLLIESGATLEVKSGATLQIDSGATYSKGGAVTKTAVVALTGGTDTGGGLGAWANAETGTIWVNKTTISNQGPTGVVAAASLTIDAGTTATNATTSSDNLIDAGGDFSAAHTGDNFTDHGTNGKSGQALATGKWVTFSTSDSTASAGFVGKAVIEYLVLP